MTFDELIYKDYGGPNIASKTSLFNKESIKRNELITTITSSEGKQVNVTGNVDAAMKLAFDAEGRAFEDADFKRVLRKTDFYLMPLFCFLYACQFMDKNSTSYASVMGLRTDLNMISDQYSWLGTAFYLGYLIFEFPVSTLLQRFPVSKTVSFFIVLWGIILCLHSTPQYAGFVALRTLLGACESAITPAMVIFTSQWYKTEEQFLRTAFWFCCNGFGTIMGGAIAYGISVHENSYSIHGWRILFIVVGLMTITIGIAFFFHIPDTPDQAWFLTHEEKLIVIERIRSNQQGFGNKHFKKHQFIEALLDINTWLYFFFAIASNIPNGALTNFGNILLEDDFGYTAQESLYMNMPTGAVQIVGCLLFAYSYKYIPHRMAISIFALIISLACSCMLAFADSSPRTRLAGYYLLFVYPVSTICALSCFSSNTAGHTKKVCTNAFFLIGYCVGNLVGPQTFITAQAPKYAGGKVSIVVCYCAGIVLLSWIYLNYMTSNRKRERLKIKLGGEIDSKIDNVEFADLTDKENPNFRYRL